MAYCRNCGAQIDDRAVMCPACGVMQENSTEKREYDVLWALVGFFVPLVGLILYLIWKDEKPKAAKAAGIGALVSTCGGIALGVLYFLVVVVLLGGVLGGAAALL